MTLLRKNEKVKEAYEALLNDIQSTNPEFKARFMVFCESFLLQHKKYSMSLDDTMFDESYLKERKIASKFFSKWSFKLNQVYAFLIYIFNSTKRKYYVHCIDAEQRLKEGDLKRSIEEYKKALNYYYEYNDAFDELLKIYFYQKEYKSIAECFAKLKEYKKVLKLLSHEDAVEKSKESIIAELKNHIPLVIALGHYYYRLGEYRKAINIFNIAVFKFSDAFYYKYQLGLSYLGANNLKKALIYFEKAFQKINPDVAKLRLDEMMRLSKEINL
jgi:tetratricopeptide (TPR) repeat protein